MYIFLFGNESLRMYDLIGTLGLLILLLFFLCHKTWPRAYGTVALEAIARGADARRKPLWHRPRFWSVVMVAVPLVVHLVFFALGGEWFAPVVERATEFFGYVLLSAVGMALAAGALGCSPLAWLDRTVPLYLSMATVLKLSCFCAGCCHGMPWAYGLYNARMGRTEFPIQLVEMALYVVLFFLLLRYRGRPGQRFALFLTGYAGVRFVVQFFRTDRPVFSAFHWMSGVFFLVGVVLIWLFRRPANETKERT